MIEELKLLKTALGIVESLDEDLRNKKELFYEQNKELIDSISESKEKIDALKNQISIKAVNGFKADGLKKRQGGIGIRCMTNLVYDVSEAFGWAKKHELCLKLDVANFKKIAKAQDLSFVKKEETVIATFPKEIKIGDEE